MIASDAIDVKMMRRALTLAARGRLTTSPNPAVGCVIVSSSGEVVGEGWHERAGEPHAEIVALLAAGERARGATVYVTLEPCAHTGRTPPCTNALIEAGVARVISAMSDPNPEVAGLGYSRLRNANIEVTTDVERDDAECLNRGYISRYKRGKPFIRCKLAMSMDGRTAMASGESQWITGDLARQRVHKMRAESCAIVTGIGTIVSDNPQFTAREPYCGHPVQRQPALIVMDTHARLSPEAAVFDADRPLWQITSQHKEIDKSLDCHKQWRCMGAPTVNDKLDVKYLSNWLAEEGYGEVLLEAGSILSASFLSAGLIDELVLFVAPKVMGAVAQPLFCLELETMGQAIRFEWQSVELVGDDVMMVAKPILGASK